MWSSSYFLPVGTRHYARSKVGLIAREVHIGAFLKHDVTISLAHINRRKSKVRSGRGVTEARGRGGEGYT